MMLSEDPGIKWLSDKPSEVPGTGLDELNSELLVETKTGIELVRATCLING